MSQAVICSTLISATEPLQLGDIAKAAGVPPNNVSAVLYTLAQAGVIEKVGDAKPFAWRVKNVDEAKRRATGKGLRGRPRQAKKAAKVKTAEPRPKKTAKRRKAEKRQALRERAPARDPFLFSVDNEGDLQICDRTSNDAVMQIPREWALKLGYFIAGMRHLLEPGKGKRS